MYRRHSHRFDLHGKTATALLVLLGVWLGWSSGQVRANPQAARDIFVDSGQALGSSYSYAVALGDLDGDGNPDAFVANYNSQGDRVWINDGAARFSDSGQSLGIQNSRGVALGDVDGDGDLDAFVAGSVSKLWINQGGAQHGTQGVFLDSGQNLGNSVAEDVALGDLDGDGDLDAFVANYSGPNKVWVNQGGAQHGTPGVFADSGQNLNSLNSYGVALGDVDRDGDLDAVVANYTQGDILWLNQGGAQGGTQGVFHVGQGFTGPNCFDVTLGDLDGDGDLDIFFADYNQGNMVWLNQGGAQSGTEGTFTDSGQLLGNGPSYGVALADVDGDLDLDAVVANYNASDEVWLNDGSGNFSRIQNLDTVLSRGVALADLDGNGSTDAFIATETANAVWVGANHWTAVDPPEEALNAPLDAQLQASTAATLDPASLTTDSFQVQGSFVGRVAGHTTITAVQMPGVSQASNAWFYPDESFFPGELIAASLVDSITDLNGIPFAAFTWQFRTRTPGGLGVFNDTHQSLGNAASKAVVLGDFDDDGDLDALVANGDNQPDQVWLNAGGNQAGVTGVFVPGVSVGNTSSINLALGDLDGDGYPDAIRVENGPNWVLRNLGNGAFGQYAVLGNANSRAAALGDLDGDGDLDIFVANTDVNKVWLNHGSATFSDSGQNLGAEDSWGVALGDLDRDGDLDAVTADSGVNHAWLNDGTGTFTAQALGSTLTPSTGVALGDLNGDGYPDAFFTNATADEVWLNDGTGTLTLTQSLGNAASYAVALGDLDHDGDLDALVSNSAGPSTIWLNDGTGTFTESGQSLGTGFIEDAALGDLNGDGSLDAFFAVLNGPNAVWINLTAYRTFLPLARH